jgi:hypothetical protein
MHGKQGGVMSGNYPHRAALCVVCIIGLMTALPASAQQSSPSQNGAVHVAATIDFMNQYMFRGVRQNSTGMAMWPAVDVGVNVHSGDGKLKAVRVGGAFLSSLHTGDTGRQGPTGKLWYESRMSGSVGLRFAGGGVLDATYAVFTSPNEMFTTVKEIAVRAALEGRPAFGVQLDPYALVAVEMDAGPGDGQLDGGLHAGRYLEIGIAPRFVAGRVALSVPVTTGLSIGDYYELAMDDRTFGFVTVGGVVSVPLRRSGTGLSLRGGVHYHALGAATKFFNGGDRSAVVGSIGLAVSR